MRLVSVLLLLFFAGWAVAQQPAQGETTCTFADGKQVTLRYPQLPHSKNSNLPDGHPWPSDQTPLYLFSQADLVIGSVTVPAGAYGVYTLPANKNAWDLVVTRDVKQDGKYDSSQDVARTAMQTGSLPNATNTLTAYFGHIAPQTCALRLDYGKERGYTDVKEK